MNERRVVVIGGGVIGTACAYYLAKEGWRVTVLERARIGQACSRGNCGVIGLSRVLPLNVPGAVRTALRGMLQPSSPFAIRPRWDPRLWSWLMRFALRCTKAKSIETGRTLAALLASTDRLYGQLMEEEPIDCELEHHGCLFAFRSREAMEHYATVDALQREQYGVGAERLDGEAVRQAEPTLREGLAGGWFYPQDYHLRPDRLVASWRRVAESMGVTFREGCEVTEILRDARRRGAPGRAVAVVSQAGEIETDAVVAAAGAVTPRMRRMLGCRIPIQPGKGYSITTTRPEPCPRGAVLLHERKVMITPFASGFRIGSTMEFAGYDRRLRPERFALLENAAKEFLHAPQGDSQQEFWYGWRAMSYDGRPYIGRSPAYQNVWVATGHNMLGLTMAPVTGKLIAELASGQKPHLDVAPLALQRT